MKVKRKNSLIFIVVYYYFLVYEKLKEHQTIYKRWAGLLYTKDLYIIISDIVSE